MHFLFKLKSVKTNKMAAFFKLDVFVCVLTLQFLLTHTDPVPAMTLLRFSVFICSRKHCSLISIPVFTQQFGTIHPVLSCDWHLRMALYLCTSAFSLFFLLFFNSEVHPCSVHVWICWTSTKIPLHFIAVHSWNLKRTRQKDMGTYICVVFLTVRFRPSVQASHLFCSVAKKINK